MASDGVFNIKAVNGKFIRYPSDTPIEIDVIPLNYDGLVFITSTVAELAWILIILHEFL